MDAQTEGRRGFPAPRPADISVAKALTAGGVFARLAATVLLVAEHAAALMVIAEITLLLAGVTARYIFHTPLAWSDELASLLFVWLTMLGSTIALARSQHLRLTALESRLEGEAKRVLRISTLLLTFGFLAWLSVYAFEHAQDATYATNPVLNISEGWKSASVGIGLVMMAIICLSQLLNVAREHWRALAIALGCTLAALAVILAASRLTDGRHDLIIFFLGAGGTMVLIGVPIAISFGLTALTYLAWATELPLSIVSGRFEAGMSHMILLSVPMFVALGLLFEMTGMARSLIAFLAALVGHLRGGLSYVLLGAMYLVSGISGAKAADMAAIAPALVPEMRKRGVPDSELVSLLAGASAMSETIPPSLVLITIGVIAGVSIGALFTGGLLPAAVLALLMCVVAWINAGRSDIATIERATWGAVFKTFAAALPGLVLPVIIRTAVVEGIATATEVATIGILYIALFAVAVRRFDPRQAYRLMQDTAALSGAIMIILGAANAVSWALTQTGFSQDLASAIATLPGGATSFWAISIVVFIVSGSVLEGIPALVIFGPLLFPIARSLGIHDVQYALVAVLAMGVGLYMPPFGVGYYTACAIARIDPGEGMLRIWPYLGVLVLGIFIVAAVPWISIGFLPR
ncbi:TRAP transporter large permease subunit [Ancylobacter pratisalsi]|uniref:TRAP transporter large permease subunit n=1 Tax=Ancylobacter pratisalsi TaxID=1745854 RepID=A0A6P1YK70_9HYPH|nr:TRAP transporter large permease subunit [Ancylobacter pratisalsi]QIB33106.1 TRAP transporter large permease subunit [Ancylobacter pratisalsi]